MSEAETHKNIAKIGLSPPKLQTRHLPPNIAPDPKEGGGRLIQGGCPPYGKARFLLYVNKQNRLCPRDTLAPLLFAANEMTERYIGTHVNAK